MTAEPTEPTSQPAVPEDLRASHADRDAVVERLRDAAAEGRLDLEELEDRVEAALTAKTQAQLTPLTADLPGPVPPPAGQPLTLKGGMHGTSRTGRWDPPARMTAHGGMGGVLIDFTRVVSRLPEIEIEAYGEMAGVTVVLPEGWSADVTGVDPGIGGVTDRTTPDRLPGTPLVRLTGKGGAAGVVVRHPNRWERRKLRRNPPPRAV